MFSNQFFYHSTVRNVISVFGTLFNNIYVTNVDDKTSTEIKTSKVPITYSKRDRQIERILSSREKDFDTNKRVAIQLPRMSFELTSMEYSSETSVSMFKRHNHKIDSSDMPFRSANRSWAPAPYMLGIQLNIYGRQQDEVLQIVEQIIPYFRPDFMVTMKQAKLNSVWDMPITLNSVTPQDETEGSFEDNRRIIVYTLDFSVLARFFGPISDQGVITKAIANVFEVVPDTILDQGGKMVETVTVEALRDDSVEAGYIVQESVSNTYFFDDDDDDDV